MSEWKSIEGSTLLYSWEGEYKRPGILFGNPRPVKHFYWFGNGLLKRIIRNRNARNGGRLFLMGDSKYWYMLKNGKAYEWKYGKWMYKSKSFVREA